DRSSRTDDGKICVFFFQAEDGIRDRNVTGVQTCALPIWLVEMKRGATPDGKGDYAETLADEDYWDLRLVVVLTAEDGKEVGSTQGMIHTADRKSTRLNSSHVSISYAVFCLKKKTTSEF